MSKSKPFRFPPHTAQNLHDREIALEEVEQTLQKPEFVAPTAEGRQVYMRRYRDSILNQEMLLRVIVEETQTELIIVTVYKTSRIQRYLKGLQK